MTARELAKKLDFEIVGRLHRLTDDTYKEHGDEVTDRRYRDDAGNIYAVRVAGNRRGAGGYIVTTEGGVL